MIKKYFDNKLFEFIRKNRERVTLVTVISIFVLSVGGGFLLQKNRSATKELQDTSLPKKVELKVTAKSEASGQSEGVSDSASFFLKPSPDELLQQLTSLENFNEDVVEGKYTGLRVLWPAYFFTLQANEGNKATLVLDVKEDGFGVVIESEVDIASYPQLKELETGKKLWIGGEILAVDRSGTGTVFLKAENFNFGDNPIFPDTRHPAN